MSAESSDNGKKKNVSRRGFLAGASVFATGLAAAGLTACSPKESGAQAADPSPSAPEEGAGGATRPEWGLPEFVETADETMEADIVVVGTGMAGFSSALTATEQGASVIMLEKNPGLGGGTSFAEGLFAIGSPLQEELGIPADASKMLQAEFSFQRYVVDSTLWNVVAGNSPEDVRWLMDQGVEFAELGAGGPAVEIRTQHLFLEHRGRTAIAALEKKAEELGVTIRKSARAVHLLKEGDKVVGVQADAGKSTLNVNARAVVLATGGVGDNQDLINTYTNRNADNMYWCGGPNITGDGIMMAAEAGMGKPYRIGGPGLGVTVEPFGITSHIGAAAGMQPTNLWVNQNGLRFFNEDQVRMYTYPLNAIDSQLKTFSVFDQDMYDLYVNEGAVSAFGYYVLAGEKLTDLESQMEQALSSDNPYVFVADTLEELAGKMGVPTDAFLSTVEAYNGSVEEGVDPQFSKDPQFLKPVKTGPFYGFRVKSNLLQWLGGIHVNSNAEVIQGDGTVIPGLYAAGNDCGGFQGETYGLNIPGSCQGIALGMGRQSGRNAAAYVGK